MRSRRTLVALAALSLLALPAAAAPAKAPLEVTGVTLRIRHRVFANFQEDRQVRPRQVFQVGDTDYQAQIVRFVPDFAMNAKSRKVVTRSPEPKNPALQIIVREKGAAQDTTWAFLNFPPHFSRNSLLAFQVLRIDFKNHPPVVFKEAPKDSTAASARAAARTKAPARAGKR